MTERTKVNANSAREKTGAREERREKKALTGPQLAALVAELEATGDFQVLKRLVPLPLLRGQSRSGLRCAIIVDTETTGLLLPPVSSGGARGIGDDSRTPFSQLVPRAKNFPPPSEPVSIGMVGVAYDPSNGEIRGAIGRFHKLREPSHSIPEAASKIHGIRNEDVRGSKITETEIAEWIALTTAAVQDGVQFGTRDEAKLPLIVAHNAGFDRPMLEGLYPNVFSQLPWACSHKQVPWADHGFEGTKLAYLAMRAGFFYGARHSALADADAVVELLRQSLGENTAMALLRAAARRDTSRIYVTTSYNPQTISGAVARNTLLLSASRRDLKCRERVSNLRNVFSSETNMFWLIRGRSRPTSIFEVDARRHAK